MSPTREAHQNGRNYTDPQALAWDGQLRDRSAADSWLVYRAVETALARLEKRTPELPEKADRERLAREAFNACWESRGRFPSKRDYENWYSKQGKAAGFPSCRFIENVLGGGKWTKACEEMGGNLTPKLLNGRKAARGKQFTPDELLDLLRYAAAALKQEWLTYPVFRKWADGERESPTPGAPRVAVGRMTFARCGGWQKAVIDAGLKPYAPAGRWLGGTASRALTDDELLEAVRELAPKPEGQRFTYNDFDASRARVEEPAAAEGHPLPHITAKLIVDRLGSWPDALLAAGLVDEVGRRLLLQAKRMKLDDGAALEVLALALDRYGPSLDRRLYVPWRKQAAIDGVQGFERYPSYRWFVNRFDSFDGAKRLAQQRRRKQRAAYPASEPATLPAPASEAGLSINARRAA